MTRKADDLWATAHPSRLLGASGLWLAPCSYSGASEFTFEESWEVPLSRRNPDQRERDAVHARVRADIPKRLLEHIARQLAALPLAVDDGMTPGPGALLVFENAPYRKVTEEGGLVVLAVRDTTYPNCILVETGGLSVEVEEHPPYVSVKDKTITLNVTATVKYRPDSVVAMSVAWAATWLPRPVGESR